MKNEKPKKVKSFEDKADEVMKDVDVWFKSKYGGTKRALAMSMHEFNEMKGRECLEYDEAGYLVEVKQNQYRWMPKNLFELGRF